MVERVSPRAAAFIDVLDRVLDNGIVFDTWLRLSVAGIDLITVQTHVIVVSIDTYLKYGTAFDPAVLQSNLPPSTVATVTPVVSPQVSVPMSHVLFIIAADRPDLFQKWIAEFPELAQGHVVVLDRRRSERRQQIESIFRDHRLSERRKHTIERELELAGLAVVALPQNE